VCEIEIWPCNLEAYSMFMFLQTQWHVGMAGRTGLIYRAAQDRMDELGIVKRKRRLALMNQLRVMEFAVLEVQAEESSVKQKPR
jgi:hypothetical protein